jgi:hypothetical protein
MARLQLDHPFWHLCLGGFTANVLVFTHLPLDYLLFVVVPAMLALAWTEASPLPASAQAPSPTSRDGR